jgi:hypothetical protein
MSLRDPFLLLSAAAFNLLLAAGTVSARQEALLNVEQGQIPNDTGSDGLTKMTIEDCKDLGGKALKVVFAAADSFGDRQARIKNWKPFISLQFEVFNPAKDKVPLTLTVRHKRTTSFQTRVDYPFALKPGKNSVKIGIDELMNVNGTAPDLSEVGKWYFASDGNQTPTLYFGSIWLVGDDLPAMAPGPAGGVAGPAARYRIKGKVGDLSVDLTATPEDAGFAATAGAASAAAPTVASDPARLARIRAAKMAAITKPVMFDTPEADAILSALEVYPPDNAWNLVISDWPLHPNSKNIIASIGPDKPFRYNPDMGFVLVPPDQKRVPVKIVEYAGESDPGPFPVPDNMPIEGWPVSYQRDAKAQGLTLEDVQRDELNQGGDRHGIVVDPVNRMLYEFYQAKKTPSGWQAAQTSIFDLKSNRLRPDGWTSADAAGLPIFPATVRYDELQRGIVEHALRVTVTKTRRAYVSPATHYASRLEDENLPRMGERLRLRADYDISGFSPQVQAILKGLKKYGMFVADNGIDWAISVAPDPRINNLHEELRRIKGSAFEVVQAPSSR